MSSFSSIVRKGGQQFKPKPTARRNVPRKVAAEPSRTETESTSSIIDTGETGNTQSQEIARSSHERTVSAIPTASPNLDTVPTIRPSLIDSTADVQSPSNSTPTENSRIPSPLASRLVAGHELETQTTTIAREPIPQETRGRKRKIQQQGSTAGGDTAVSVTPAGHPPANNHGARAVPQDQVVSKPTTNTRKKRKSTPRATPSLALSQAQSRTPSSFEARTLQTAANGTSNAPIDLSLDLFKSATDQAASVSSLANNIYEQSQSQRAREHQASNDDVEVVRTEANGEETSSTVQQATARRKQRKKTVQEQAAEIVASAMGEKETRSRRRGMTPENAEEYKLDPNEVTMGNLCKDSKLGKKSTLEKEMQANWPEILERRKEDREKALAAAQSRRRKAFGKPGPIAPLQETVAAAPTMVLVNGKIIVGAESREIDRSAQLVQAAVLDENNVREDKDYYKRVNQSTVGMKASYGRKFRWDGDTTEQFYKGLRMFGTDFLMIANMFPGLDRKQIKKKFIREENADKARVMEHLQNREEVNLEEYSQIAEIQLQDVKAVEEDIKAEEKRLRDEDNERRKNAGLKANTNDGTNLAVPSTEPADGTAEDGNTAEATEGSGRYASLAAEIMAPQPKRQRRVNNASKKRGPKAGRLPAGGVEELLGSTDEVGV